jgi:hypothetical protein
LVVVAAAVSLYVLLLVYVTPPVPKFLRRASDGSAERYPDAASSPDAILYVPIQREDGTEEPPTLTITEDVEIPTRPLQIAWPDASETEQPAEPADEPTSSKVDASSEPPPDLGDIAGAASRTLPPGPEAELVQIPPRPVQITWPDTHQLKHCLGHQINVDIQVDQEGRILRVEAEASDHPSDCVEAALESARKILFAPGRINGKPAKMWTRFRIDFRGKE